jgi:hypothetical protein
MRSSRALPSSFFKYEIPELSDVGHFLICIRLSIINALWQASCGAGSPLQDTYDLFASVIARERTLDETLIQATIPFLVVAAEEYGWLRFSQPVRQPLESQPAASALDRARTAEQSAAAGVSNRRQPACTKCQLGWGDPQGRTKGMGEAISLDLIGFSEEALKHLNACPELQRGLTDEDAVPEPAARAVSQPADVWLLGCHRLLCGDSTELATIQTLLAGEKAAMTFTDPRYKDMSC